MFPCYEDILSHQDTALLVYPDSKHVVGRSDRQVYYSFFFL